MKQRKPLMGFEPLVAHQMHQILRHDAQYQCVFVMYMVWWADGPMLHNIHQLGPLNDTDDFTRHDYYYLLLVQSIYMSLVDL